MFDRELPKDMTGFWRHWFKIKSWQRHRAYVYGNSADQGRTMAQKTCMDDL